jgi:Domain of unknown function (DUF202)
LSVIRTSLSLITFGFTIFQVFEKLRDQNVITHAAAPRNFGIALVALGVLMLAGGIGYHAQFMYGLREQHTTAGQVGPRPGMLAPRREEGSPARGNPGAISGKTLMAHDTTPRDTPLSPAEAPDIAHSSRSSAGGRLDKASDEAVRLDRRRHEQGLEGDLPVREVNPSEWRTS